MTSTRAAPLMVDLVAPLHGGGDCCVMCRAMRGTRSRYFGVTVCSECERNLYRAQIMLRDHGEGALICTLYPEEFGHVETQN